MMKYKPGDMNKITDTVIALDIGFTAVLQAISQHDRPLSNEICIALATGIRVAPANLRGVGDLLSRWKEILETPPTPKDAH